MRTGIFITLLVASIARAEAPQSDSSIGTNDRNATTHPCLTIKPADVARAKENMRRYVWAKEYADSLSRKASDDVTRFTPAYVEHLIEPTTPISAIFTPCPACRALGKTWHPQGQWTWSPEQPDKLTCEVCGTVFPSDKYPESVVLHSTWGSPQTFSFIGGEPFKVFTYETGRPSISGCIRARKIQYATTACNELAEAYLLSGDARFAATVRTILLRFAAVYPHWLVHSGYGEIADMDPHVAAININKLPADELVYPPNKPDRVLHTGYWSAGRATGEGQESWFVRQIAFAYDATCEAKDESGKAIYSDAERKTIERDLLLESTVLLRADTSINNKSVANRSAAAMVGLVLGEPSLVHFGLDGFHKTIDQWFLPDGGTPESFAYALMVFNGTHELPIATLGYSDPPGYRDPTDGTHLDKLDLFHGDGGKGESAYGRAWSAFVNSLQGDLTLPPIADTRAKAKLSSQWADLLVWQYPDHPQYLSLLKALCGGNLRDATPSFAIWHREPGLEDRPAGPLVLPEVCLPDLRIGEMRTGGDGRESLLILNASHWGSHHHWDSLNLYYWKNGQELLSDLGYLWDNPQKHQTARTVAHNTVVLDEQDQRDKERGGDVKFFVTSPHVKAMRASSDAYAQAKRYERTSVLVDHSDGKSYVADFFIVEGGKTQDFIFHGPNQTFVTTGATTQPSAMKLYDFTNVRTIDAGKNDAWHMDWTLDDKTIFSAWSMPQDGEEAFVADGWGQRDPFNKDRGATLPYIVRRCTGGSTMYFTSVFEGHPAGVPLVSKVRRIHRGSRLTIEVETSDGSDTIESDRSGIRVTSTIDKTTQWEFSNEH